MKKIWFGTILLLCLMGASYFVVYPNQHLLISLSHKLGFEFYNTQKSLSQLIQEGKIGIATKEDKEKWLKEAYKNSNKNYLYAGEFLLLSKSYIILKETKLPYFDNSIMSNYCGIQPAMESYHFMMNNKSLLPVGYRGENSFYFIDDGSCMGINPNCDDIKEY